MSHEYLSLSYARILFRHLQLKEEDEPRFFDGTGLDSATLMALDAHVPFAQQRALFANALALAAEPHLGLSVGRHLHLPSHGPLGVAAFSAPNLGQALACLVRFSRVRAQFVTLRISSPQHDANDWQMTMHETVSLDGIRCFLHESVMSAITAALVFFSGGAELEGEIAFAYSAPSYADEYGRYLPLRVRFDAPHTALGLPFSALNLPSPVADARLHAEAVAKCERALLAFGRSDDLAEQVRDLIQRNPGKLWACSEVAAALNMSARTLIRRLQGKGLQYQQIRDDVVMAQAKLFLADPDTSVALASHLLGFADVASFRRSFKRVVGLTPQTYREGLFAHSADNSATGVHANARQNSA